MEENRTLYPLKFGPLRFDRFWGKDAFKLADLGFRDSLVSEGWLAGNTIGEVMETYLDRIVGERSYDYYGRQFPICVREMHVNGRTPLQVHPDDTVAGERFDFLGKNKLWYVLSASGGAHLHIGFREPADASALWDACSRGDGAALENMFASFPAQTGSSILIPAGVPHYASGELTLLEISESSPLDFCLHNWGQQPDEEEFDSALPIVEALDFIDYNPYSPSGKADDGTLADIPQFTVIRRPLESVLKVSGEGETDGFVLYCCISGSGDVQYRDGDMVENTAFRAGDVVLVPAECTDYALLPTGKDTVLLEVSSEMQITDSYIDPAVPARLPGEED